MRVWSSSLQLAFATLLTALLVGVPLAREYAPRLAGWDSHDEPPLFTAGPPNRPLECPVALAGTSTPAETRGGKQAWIAAAFDRPEDAAAAVAEETAVSLERVLPTLVAAHLEATEARAANEATARLEQRGGLLLRASSFGGRALADLTCTAESDQLAHGLAVDLASYLPSPVWLDLRPPWDPEPISVQERDARITSALGGRIPHGRARGLHFAEAAVHQKDEEVLRLRRLLDSLSSDDPGWDAARNRLTERLGAARPGRAIGARAGGVDLEGRELRLGRLLFDRLPDGLPALAAWLCDRGCRDLRWQATDVTRGSVGSP